MAAVFFQKASDIVAFITVEFLSIVGTINIIFVNAVTCWLYRLGRSFRLFRMREMVWMISS